jgi:hypothetical protein
MLNDKILAKNAKARVVDESQICISGTGYAEILLFDLPQTKLIKIKN